MAIKSYKVNFARTAVGANGDPIGTYFAAALTAHGPNLPAIDLERDRHQVRDLRRVGRVWQGVFARLREEAPHIVNAMDREREISLDAGDHILEKCHFMYREIGNVLIWQVSRDAGGLGRAQEYLSRALEQMVVLSQVMNDADLQRVLDGQVYELSFAYAPPANLGQRAPAWNQHAFDMMGGIHAAHAKFMMRGPRNGSLSQSVKRMISQLLEGTPGAEKIRVRLTDESDPIELFMAPLKDEIRVELYGRYPSATEVFAALEEAYDRQRANIPA